MARVIVLTSGKGGVGKTTITANLGLHLASQNYRVCVIDMDIGLNNLDVALNLDYRVIYTMLDVIEGRARLKEALIQDDNYPLLYLMSTGGLNQNLSITISQIRSVVNSLKEMFDFVLVDCPAGIDAGFKRAVSMADEALIVVTPHLSSIRDASKVSTILSSFSIDNQRFVVNRARGDLIEDNIMCDVYEIGRTLGIDFGGVIPDDDSVLLINGTNIKNNKFVFNRAMSILANNILTGETKMFDCTYRYKGLLGGILKKLKRSV